MEILLQNFLLFLRGRRLRFYKLEVKLMGILPSFLPLYQGHISQINN